MRRFVIVFSFLMLIYCSWGQASKLGIGASNLNHSEGFFENKGQWPTSVLFKSDVLGGKIWVQQHKLIYHQQDLSAMHENHGHLKPGSVTALKETVVHVNFLNSNEVIDVEYKGKTPYYHNYLIGKDSSKWGRGVYGYQEFTLKNYYTSIDMTWTLAKGQHKYQFTVHPGANPADIMWEYVGQKRVDINRKGQLKIETELGSISEEKPLAFQLIDGRRVEVKCRFILEGNQVHFELGNYDKTIPLVIDPVLVFATYNGAFSDNFGMTATYGNNGVAFSAGTVYGNNFPIPNVNVFDPSSNFTAISGNYGITDVFITKYNSQGTALLWATFLGGGNSVQGTETANSLICDSLDNICIFGATSSVDFPTSPGAFQPNHAGGVAGANFTSNGVYFQNQGSDIYVTKISANGQNLLASTYVGGSGNDGVNYNVSSTYDSLVSNYGDQFRGEIMLDEQGNTIIASCTRSLNFPTLVPFQATNNGQEDGVIFRLNPNFTNIQFSTYYGGTQNDACYSVKIDTLANVVVCGGTSSSDLSGTVGGLMGTYQGGKSDGFVIRLNPTGTALTAGTYLGRTAYDQTFFVEVDRDNNIFVLGQSVGGTFPVWNAPYTNPSSSQFVIKLNNNLSTNMASTQIGNGSSQINISPSAFLVDICGNIYVSGWGANILQNIPISGMPVSPNAFQSTTTGFDFYLMVIEHDFQSLLYATYMGGPSAAEHVDGGTSRFDKNGVVYQSVCGGCGGLSDFPTTPGAYSASNNSSNCNNLLFKFDFQLIPTAIFNSSANIGCEDLQVNFINFSSQNDSYLWNFGNNQTSSTIFNPIITYTEPGVYNVFLYVTDSVCLLTDTALTTITVLDSIDFNLYDTLSLCSNAPFLLSLQVNGTANEFIWSQSPNFTNPLNSNPSNPSVLLISSNPGWYYVSVSNGFCTTTDSVFVEFDVPVNASFLPSVVGGCVPLSVNFNNSSSITSNFYWDFGNGVMDSVNYNASITYTQAGSYLVSLIIVDSLCASSDTANFIINVSPSVAVNLTDVIYLCSSEAITLQPFVSGAANYFIWSTNNQFTDTLNATILDTTLLLIDPQPGYYYFQAGNNNCFVTDSVSIEIFSNQLNLIASNTLCLGDSLLATVINSGQELFTYEWSPLSIILNPSNSNQVYVQPLTSQYIYVEATSANNCVVNDSVFVNVFYLDPSSVIASAQPTLVVPGSQVLLSGLPSGMATYSWSPTSGLNTPTLQNTFATVQQTTIFTLTVSDGVCFISDTTEVKVYEIICDHPYVFVPNAFSPNGDGNNDILFVRGLWVEKVIFRIFDRWGELVFESDQVSNGWDGTFQGRKLDPDVYDYYLDVTCIGGLKSISKGNVTLMK